MTNWPETFGLVALAGARLDAAPGRETAVGRGKVLPRKPARSRRRLSNIRMRTRSDSGRFGRRSSALPGQFADVDLSARAGRATGNVAFARCVSACKNDGAMVDTWIGQCANTAAFTRRWRMRAYFDERAGLQRGQDFPALRRVEANGVFAVQR